MCWSLALGYGLAKTSAWTAQRGMAWAAPHAVWTCGDLPLERVAKGKFTGMVFSAIAGIAMAPDKRWCLQVAA